MVSARLEGGKKRGTGGGGRGMECRRVKAEHKVFKGQPREGRIVSLRYQSIKGGL